LYNATAATANRTTPIAANKMVISEDMLELLDPEVRDDSAVVDVVVGPSHSAKHSRCEQRVAMTPVVNVGQKPQLSPSTAIVVARSVVVFIVVNTLFAPVMSPVVVNSIDGTSFPGPARSKSSII
jgi:hypothetical protein